MSKKANGIFSDRELNILNELNRRLFPKSPSAFISADDINLGDKVNLFFTDMSKDFKFGLKLMLMVIQWLPLFFIGKFKRFTSLNDMERDLYLSRFSSSKFLIFRMIFKGLKVMSSFVFYDDKSVLEDMGHERSCLVK